MTVTVQDSKFYSTTVVVDEHDKDMLLRYIREEKEENPLCKEMPVDLMLGATLASAVASYFKEKEKSVNP